MAFEFTKQQLTIQQSKARYRKRVCIQQPEIYKEKNSNRIIVDGKKYINFSSNDYLGLNNHLSINKAMQQGVDKFGICASSSSLVTGFHYAHKALEDKICQWLNKPKCLLFSSGFAANEALFKALGQESSCFYLDKLSHASMIDGALSSKAMVKRFAHNNIEHLSNLLSQNHQKDKLIASEGIFSMDGDRAKLLDLENVAIKNNAWLYLDDAHSIGVIGEQGQGSSYYLNNKSQPSIIMATLGKAIATSGAFLTCDENLHDYLINFARHYIYSTAISPAIAWATIASIELIQKEQWRRETIVEFSNQLVGLLDNSIEIITSESSIKAIIIGDENKALSVSEKLKKHGIWLTAIRPPTVAPGTSRLRVTICSNHNENDIKYLASCLNEALI